MKILVLGGTGAMGTPLVSILESQNEVWVTSRRERASHGNIHYLLGNAKDLSFLNDILPIGWDTIVDFIVRSKDEFSKCRDIFLENTKQYVCISSARVYAQTDGRISENTPRLLDVSEDDAFLQSKEYSLEKARIENLLMNNSRKNYTIIRPSITYNTYRLQLGVMEKEAWLYRAMKGRSIVFSEDMKDRLTTMTYGNDVARGIASIIGKPDALGEVFHITNNSSLPWRDVLNIYTGALENILGRRINVCWTPTTTNLFFKYQQYQIKYCRYYNRTFDNSKIGFFIDVSSFVNPEEGLSTALREFFKAPQFKPINWTLEAINDRAAHERTPFNEIPSLKNKIIYMCYRYNMEILIKIIYKLIKLKKIL